MAIEQQSYLFEFMMRFDATGFRGAHQIVNERIVNTETNVVLAETMGPAMPVASGEIAAIVGQQAVILLNTIAVLDEQNDALRAEIERLNELLKERQTSAQLTPSDAP